MTDLRVQGKQLQTHRTAQGQRDLEIFGDNSVVGDSCDFEIYLWWDQPAKEVSEDNVVSKWNNVLDLPED